MDAFDYKDSAPTALLGGLSRFEPFHLRQAPALPEVG